jgi:hypothetical protein
MSGVDRFHHHGLLVAVLHDAYYNIHKIHTTTITITTVTILMHMQYYDVQNCTNTATW